MRIRRSSLLFCAAAAVILALVIWFANKRPPETRSAGLTETKVAPPETPASGASDQTTLPATETANGADLSRAPPPNKAERAIGLLGAYNNVPIVFYGKVEDQFSNVVANAKVNFSIRVYNGVRSGVDNGQLTSDVNGLFTISGYKGESLDVVPVKTGYVPLSMNGSGIYSLMWPEEQRAHPDPHNPVVIRMWKLQGEEPLVGISREYRLPFTNAPLFLDLLTGILSDNGGDMEIIIIRASGPLYKRAPNDWSIEFKPVNGGILESEFATSRITYAAPEDGYKDSYLVQMNRNDPAWYDNVDKVFFLKSRNGQVYSKLHLEFKINNEANGLMWFQVRGAANTNASRNWEATVGQ